MAVMSAVHLSYGSPLPFLYHHSHSVSVTCPSEGYTSSCIYFVEVTKNPLRITLQRTPPALKGKTPLPWLGKTLQGEAGFKDNLASDFGIYFG